VKGKKIQLNEGSPGISFEFKPLVPGFDENAAFHIGRNLTSETRLSQISYTNESIAFSCWQCPTRVKFCFDPAAQSNRDSANNHWLRRGLKIGPGSRHISGASSSFYVTQNVPKVGILSTPPWRKNSRGGVCFHYRRFG
jgi:hypothetical protein